MEVVRKISAAERTEGCCHQRHLNIYIFVESVATISNSFPLHQLYNITVPKSAVPIFNFGSVSEFQVANVIDFKPNWSKGVFEMDSAIIKDRVYSLTKPITQIVNI